MPPKAHVHVDWWSLVPAWLGREIEPTDGLPTADVDAAVARLAEDGFIAPALLRELHGRLGACAPLMRGFNRFAPPVDWTLLDGRLLFLDENQSVCQWLVDASHQVWMSVNGELHAERASLDEFLGVVLPYQLAQGGWPCSGDIVVPVEELETEREAILKELRWPLIARHNGLTIHGEGSRMLWSLDAMPGDHETHLFVSCLRTEDLDDLCERFDFADLS